MGKILRSLAGSQDDTVKQKPSPFPGRVFSVMASHAKPSSGRLWMAASLALPAMTVAKSVIPAKAGIQTSIRWVQVCAGMTTLFSCHSRASGNLT
jgi:hypothetical protein